MTAPRELLSGQARAISKRSAPVGLLKIDEARALLAQCKRVDEAKSIRDKAAAIKAYLHQQNASREAQNDAAEIKLRAERRLGELLAEQKAKGERANAKANLKRGPKGHDVPSAPTLADLGVEPKQATRWQDVAKVPEAKFEAYIAEQRDGDGEITTAGLRRETAADVRQVERQERSAELATRNVALPIGERKYRILYADPPWQYRDTRETLAGYETTGAEQHYLTMSVAELSALKVGDLADGDAALLCWATFPLLPDALEVVKAWGFDYKTAFVWAKARSALGNYHDASAELLLVCVRGSCTPDVSERERQIQAVAARGPHSAKPEHFRDLIQRLYPHGPRIELFRRGDAPPGWDVFGNEARQLSPPSGGQFMRSGNR